MRQAPRCGHLATSCTHRNPNRRKRFHSQRLRHWLWKRPEIAEMSSWRGLAPCGTRAGPEWRVLCRLSRTTPGRVARGRLPGTWHSELTLQVTYLPVVSLWSEVVPPPAYRVPGHPE
jgi:hypothetical protein